MASFGHQKIARQLLEKSAEVNKSDEHGQTPLHIAVFMGEIEMVRLLLEYNTDVNKVDNLVKFNNQKVLIIDSFIESESVFRFSSEKGQSSLHIAADAPTNREPAEIVCNREISKLLLEQSAEVNMTNKVTML
jgi:hypothetical protein